MGRIYSVTYGETKSQNYQSTKIEMSAQVGEHEDPDVVLEAIRRRVRAELHPMEAKKQREESRRAPVATARFAATADPEVSIAETHRDPLAGRRR